MEYLLSIIYSITDAICVLIFLSAFASFRFDDIKQHLISSLYMLSICIIILSNTVLFNYNNAIKILSILMCNILYGRALYVNISTLSLIFLAILEYLLTYLLSFTNLYISSIICKVSIQEFCQEEITAYIISSVICYFLQVVFILLIRKFVREKNKLKNSLKCNSKLIMLYLIFPLASFAMLLILLRVASRQKLGEEAIILCCLMIFVANIAILYLLGQVQKEEQNREKLLALDQQLQLQRKNIDEICNLYSAQRKQVHDFRAHINILSQLIESRKYDTAKGYLESVLEQQSERILLVDCHHSILNALFNSKISEAIKHNIDTHFEVNDLSELSLDAIDLTVLLSNLIDNAIEGCERSSQHPSIQIRACIKNNQFGFIIRNTSLPVRIIHNEISSTKSNPHLHGFGLSNIKTILNKYCGEYAMSYKDGHFQFIFEIPLNLHS